MGEDRPTYLQRYARSLTQVRRLAWLPVNAAERRGQLGGIVVAVLRRVDVPRPGWAAYLIDGDDEVHVGSYATAEYAQSAVEHRFS